MSRDPARRVADDAVEFFCDTCDEDRIAPIVGWEGDSAVDVVCPVCGAWWCPAVA